VPLSRELGFRLTQCGLGRGLLPYQVASSSIQPFGHNRHQLKTEGCALFRWGELRPHLTQCRLGRGLPPYQVASWSMKPFGLNTYGPKIGGSAPLGEGELDSHLTQCVQGQGLPACQVSSWFVQPFGHNTPMLQTDRTDNGLIACGEPFYKRSSKKHKNTKSQITYILKITVSANADQIFFLMTHSDRLHRSVSYLLETATNSLLFSIDISMGFASCLHYYYIDVVHRRPTKLCTMFGRLLGWYTIYTFSGAFASWLNFARYRLHFASKSCVLLYWNWQHAITARHSINGHQPNFVA